jgi:hypothetical protein
LRVVLILWILLTILAVLLNAGNRTLPWAGILAGKHAVRVVLILWLLRTEDTRDATGCRHNRTPPWAGILAEKHAMRVALILWIPRTDDTRDATGCRRNRTLPLRKPPRGETCHARRFDTVDTADGCSDATGCRHNRTLPWASIFAGKRAMHVVWILWILLKILTMLLAASTTGHSPGQASSRGHMPCASFSYCGYC